MTKVVILALVAIFHFAVAAWCAKKAHEAPNYASAPEMFYGVATAITGAICAIFWVATLVTAFNVPLV